MAINADHPVLVIDAHAAAQLAAPPGSLDAAVGDRLDRGAVVGREIDAYVRPIFVENGMVAMETEARRDVLEIDRKAQRLRLQRLALGVVEMGLALQVAEGEGRECLVAKADLRRLESGDGAGGAVAADALLVDELHG